MKGSTVLDKIMWTALIVWVLALITLFIKEVDKVNVADAKLKQIQENYDMVVREYEALRETYENEIKPDENLTKATNNISTDVIENSQENQDIQEIHARYNSITDKLDYNIVRKGL